MPGDSPVQEATVTDGADEWDTLQEPTETENPAPVAFVVVLLGNLLVLSSIPGLATVLDGGALSVYGYVGSGVLFLSGIGVVYAAGMIYKEMQLEQEVDEP